MALEGGQNLTHEELWDDSELMDSWSEAYEEYKKYHSLAVKGEKVKLEDQHKPDIKKQSTLPNGTAASQPSTKTSNPATANAPINFIGPAAPPKVEIEASAGAFTGGSAAPKPSSATAPAPASAPAPAPAGLTSLPQTLLAAGHEETLKNIMMSWYYAGYYTGLYEGQQKAWAEMQAASQQQEGE